MGIGSMPYPTRLSPIAAPLATPRPPYTMKSKRKHSDAWYGKMREERLAEWRAAEEIRRNPPWAVRASCGCQDVVTFVEPERLNRKHRWCGKPFKRMLAEWPMQSQSGTSVSGSGATMSGGATKSVKTKNDSLAPSLDASVFSGPL